MKQSWMTQAARAVRLRHQPATEGVHIATRLRRLVSLLWILLLVVCVTAVGSMQTQANAVNELTRAIGPAFNANGQVLQAMTDAETGLLAYQASLDPVLLAPYLGAERRTTTALETTHDKLILATWAEDGAEDASLEATQRLAVQQWWTYASKARAAVARGERTDVSEGDALFVSFRRANAQLGAHLTAERDEAQHAAQSAGASGTALSIAVTLVALVLASVLGHRAARSMSRPMAELRDAMTRQHGGESDARAREDQGSAELRSLAADFNSLTQQNLGLNAELTGRLTELRKVNNNLREVQHLLTHQTLHDPLTKLPNRTLFLDRLDQSLADAVRSNRRIAVYFIDIDEFKQVNDTLGHSAGDQLLNDVANRLRSVIRPGDTVARFAGDEFLVLTQGAEDGQSAALADRVLGSLLVPPLQIGGETVTASMGVAISDDGMLAEQLLQRADAAMYQAKRAGGARWRLFGSEAIAGDVPLVAAGLVGNVASGDIPPGV
ncbi:MAG: GGDEF domain-containing protein [Dermatophilaceae bacterium]